MSTVPDTYSDDSQILKKHVSAIHAVADLTALQRKLVNALLYNAYDNLLTTRDHRINTRILCEMIGFDSKNIAYLQEALVGIMETVMQFDIMEDDGERSWEAMSLLTYVKVKGGVCTYRYEQSLAEKLYHPEIYSKINLSVLRNLRSSHALVLYENCLRYVTVGQTPVWGLDLFRKLMAVEGRYREFKFLKRDVIMPAIKEVNAHSNIQLELLTLRKGRAVSGVQFMVSTNPQMALMEMEEDDQISANDAYQTLIAEGVSKTLARAWVIDYGEAYVLDKIELTRQQAAEGKIKSSKAGFLKSAIEQDYHSDLAERKKQQAIAREKQETREELEARAEALVKQIRAQEGAYQQHCAELVEQAFAALSPEEQARVSEDFQASLSTRIYVNAFKADGWQNRLIAPDIKTFWQARGLTLPDPKAWAASAKQPDPEDLKRALEGIRHKISK